MQLLFFLTVDRQCINITCTFPFVKVLQVLCLVLFPVYVDQKYYTHKETELIYPLNMRGHTATSIVDFYLLQMKHKNQRPTVRVRPAVNQMSHESLDC